MRRDALNTQACVLLGGALVGCEAGDLATEGRREERAMPARGMAASAAPAPSDSDGRWGGRVEWRSWEEGLVTAKEQRRPMMVVVYADWCPRCKALEGVFDDPDVLSLSRRLVMIRQDHDEGPPWLRRLDAEHGSYVPRIFFFSPDGRLLKEATSGHPRYPYFYAAEHPEFLKRAMRKVAGS